MRYLNRFLEQENREKNPQKVLRGKPSKPSKPGSVSFNRKPDGAEALLPAPWDPQRAGGLLSASLLRIAELVPAGCDLNTLAMRAGIEAVDVAFEAGDGPRFLSFLGELEETARREVGAWRKGRGEHTRAIKIFSEILGCHIWVVDETGTIPASRKPDEVIYDGEEIAILKTLHDAGALSRDQMKAVHAAKKLWPGVKVQPEEGGTTPQREAEVPAPGGPARAARIKHRRTGQEVVVVDTVLNSWLKDGWEEVKPETAHDVDQGEAISTQPDPGHGRNSTTRGGKRT